jgi:hypothetical protein
MSLTRHTSLSLARPAISVFVVEGGPPASIAYLHSIGERGLADAYNYPEGSVTVEIQSLDREREPSLKNVHSVVLNYRPTGVEDA